MHGEPFPPHRWRGRGLAADWHFVAAGAGVRADARVREPRADECDVDPLLPQGLPDLDAFADVVGRAAIPRQRRTVRPLKGYLPPVVQRGLAHGEGGDEVRLAGRPLRDEQPWAERLPGRRAGVPRRVDQAPARRTWRACGVRRQRSCVRGLRWHPLQLLIRRCRLPIRSQCLRGQCGGGPPPRENGEAAMQEREAVAAVGNVQGNQAPAARSLGRTCRR
mmetsp:Transcript_138624/g.386608  ORF Transcript_138624/g.386608 Transcript_138624/m.386608 type:complete len:220 (-) Transcript_138624:107-766(-)